MVVFLCDFFKLILVSILIIVVILSLHWVVPFLLWELIHMTFGEMVLPHDCSILSLEYFWVQPLGI